MKVSIVGCNAAGASAATRLRRQRPDWDIVVFERGGDVSYANCGFCHHISGVVADRSKLFAEDAASLRSKHRLDVRLHSDVIGIDRATREIRIIDTRSRVSSVERYDKLLIAVGAEPFLPAVPGIEGPSVLTLRSVTDMDRVIERIKAGAKTATIVGGGFIGCQLAESLKLQGLSVSLVDSGTEVLPALEPNIATYLREELMAGGVDLRLGERVEVFSPAPGGGLRTDLSSGAKLKADFAVVAAGQRPSSRFARDAGLEIGETGGIVVGANQRTSDPDIYAAGDVCETFHAVTGARVVAALAGPAQMQGRVAAENIAGLNPGWDAHYPGTLGSFIITLWGMTAGATGASSELLTRSGIPYRSVVIHAPDRATYYPGACTLHLKLLFGIDGRVLGASAASRGGVARRLDSLSAAIRFGASVSDLETLQLAYSPPFGTPRDPINIAASAASAVLASDRRR